MRIHLVAFLVVVGLGSCNSLFPFAPDQVCESEVHAACHFAYACCNATERGTFASALGAGGFRNEGECVDFLLRDGSAECGNALEVYDAVNQQRFTYDQGLAQQCLQPALDALNQCQADKVFQPAKADDKCNGLGFADGNFAFGKGDVAAGKPCFQDFECATAGSVCFKKQDDAADGKLVLTEVGACKSPGNLGDDCSKDTGTDGLCAPGLFCGVDNTCDKLDLKADGQACNSDGDCASDFCDDIAGQQGATCAEKLKDGADCKDNNDCQSGICNNGGAGGGNGQVCQAQPILVVNACNGLQSDDTSFAK